MCKNGAFVFGAFGRGFAANAIADSIDVFNGSVEIFIDGDAGVFVFDAGVFKTVIEDRFTASGEDDAIDANELFGACVAEDDAFAGGVLL